MAAHREKEAPAPEPDEAAPRVDFLNETGFDRRKQVPCQHSREKVPPFPRLRRVGWSIERCHAPCMATVFDKGSWDPAPCLPGYFGTRHTGRWSRNREAFAVVHTNRG